MSDLPGILTEIAEAIGEDKARRLAEALGGHEIYPSRNPSPSSKLACVIGVDAVRKLADVLGVEKRLIPMAGRRRDVRGRELAREGLSRSEIAARVGVHERTAARYAQTVREDRQLDLPLHDDD